MGCGERRQNVVGRRFSAQGARVSGDGTFNSLWEPDVLFFCSICLERKLHEHTSFMNMLRFAWHVALYEAQSFAGTCLHSV